MLKRAMLLMSGFMLMASAAMALNISGTDSLHREQIFEVGILRVARDSAITATPSGTISTSYQLTAGMNRIVTVATAADGVKLPACTGGLVVIVANAAAANAANVFPNSSTETINALSAGTAFSLAANKQAIFACQIDGKWYSNLTA